MKTMFSKEEIEKYSQRSSQCMEKCIIEICGDIDENNRVELNMDFEENAVYCGNCFDGFYKDWSMKKYMQAMYEICEDMDGVWVSNYEYVDDHPAFRAFFIAFLFDIDEFKYYEEVYKYCHDFCDQLDILVERKIKGCYWDKIFEVDEMAFCRLYLTPFFKKIGFEQVIFNHGNKEFGKDYILVKQSIMEFKLRQEI
ncbi:MAG: hypothetical protein IJ833_02830 [Lachnospiraceae bacterium]|nr:hypothetical protein [Lachnospiraceae bacterium]